MKRLEREDPLGRRTKKTLAGELFRQERIEKFAAQ